MRIPSLESAHPLSGVCTVLPRVVPTLNFLAISLQVLEDKEAKRERKGSRKEQKVVIAPWSKIAPAVSTNTMNSNIVQSRFLSNPQDLGVVAVGFSKGQPKAGVDAGPEALIASGLLHEIQHELGYRLHGDAKVQKYDELMPASDPDHRGMKNPGVVSAVNRQISQQVYEHAREGRLVLTLGGDHSVAIGTVTGSAKAARERLGREIALIWVDAHADINTPEESRSGNIHGMPVAFVSGLATSDREEYFGWIKDDMLLSVRKLVYIGLRDVDAAEKRILRENGIKAFSMFDVDR
ncbi:A-agglutinin attachment subunit precursor [Claviceps citrina]|nr:A-agglutinin attachment subunit precursor [Claviceps citrina]